MNTYEATFIFYTDEERLKKGKELVKKEFTQQKAKFLKEDDLGERELAYLIKKESRGRYHYFEVELEPSSIEVLDKVFKLSTDILKYLFIRKN